MILQLPIPKTRLYYSRLLFYGPLYSPTITPLLQKTSYKNFARTPRETPSSLVKHTCLLVHYLTMDVLLLRALCYGDVFTDPLPSNGYTRHNTITVKKLLFYFYLHIRVCLGLIYIRK
jgi:hypothetical protein